jgi:hypothetical protein
MRERVLVAVACLVAGCNEAKPSGGAAGAGAAVPRAGDARAADASGDAKAADAGVDAGEVVEEPAQELSDTEAVTPGWKVKAAFGDSVSLFDPTPETFETLTVQVVDAKGASVFRLKGFSKLAPGTKPPGQCEELRVLGAVEAWGELAGARVSVICVNGEDDKTASEVAILLAITGTRPDVKLVWGGDADEDHNVMDACMTSHSVKFTVQGTTLTQRITDRVERGPGAERDCKKKLKRRTVKSEIVR